MKKFAGIALAIAAAASLAACGSNSAAEKSAVEKTLKASICTVTASGNPLMPDVESELSGTSNDALTVTVQQITPIDGAKYTVNISWSWDESLNETIKLVDLDDDPTHKKMEFNYPAVGAEAVSIEFKASAKCGGQTSEATFKAKLTAPETIYDPYTIAQLYEKNDSGTNFKIVGSNGKITPNHDQSFLYVMVSGKLIYKAPDSNWGLLADGANVIQLYRLDASSDNDKAIVGNYITVYCDVSNGYGNLQLAYINKIEAMTDHSSIAEPTSYVEMKAGVNDSTSPDYVSFCDNNYMNSLATVTGTYVEGSGAFSPDARWTFGLKVDETHTITVAYDYHVAKNTGADIGANYASIIAAATASTKLTVKGTIRWSTTDGTHTIGGAGGWTITPYLMDDIVVAA